ncbi:hypothetical protein ACWD0J_07295 [Streptomyces sp. NPDC003011]
MATCSTVFATAVPSRARPHTPPAARAAGRAVPITRLRYGS